MNHDREPIDVTPLRPYRPRQDVLALAERDGWSCAYCGIALAQSPDDVVWSEGYADWGHCGCGRHPDPSQHPCVVSGRWELADPDATAYPTVDHVVPRAAGGTDQPANLVLACASCNSTKREIAVGTFLARIRSGNWPQMVRTTAALKAEREQVETYTQALYEAGGAIGSAIAALRAHAAPAFVADRLEQAAAAINRQSPIRIELTTGWLTTAFADGMHDLGHTDRDYDQVVDLEVYAAHLTETLDRIHARTAQHLTHRHAEAP